MHFYRALRPIKAISFDLDDTLYDNRPVIEKTTEQTHAFFCRQDPALHHYSIDDFYRVRQALLQNDPDIYHDVTEWRLQAFARIFRDIGWDATDAMARANEVMAVFASWRSRIVVPEETFQTLAALAEHVPLVAITNGNADPRQCGLARCFKFVLSAGSDGRAKPYPDMFHLAARKLNLPLGSLLHVGDDLNTDVAGSVRSGAQACWINLTKRNLLQAPDSRLLPDVEISQLTSLTALI